MNKHIAIFTGPTTLVLAGIMAVILSSCVLFTSCKKREPETNLITPPPPGQVGILFSQTYFRASHNSYSGDISGGHRGSIRQQLDAGMRFVEFDIRHKGMFFVLGHGSEGDEVDHSHGNPASNYLSNWIKIITEWSNTNSQHVPVILEFDLKNQFSQDQLLRLNDTLSKELNGKSDRMYPANEFDSTKTLDDLKGKVLVVISGKYSDSSRVRYARLPDSLQICFVEYQKGDPTLKSELFYAAEASDNCGWAQQAREKGKVVRLWDVTNGNCMNPASNLPASNSPFFGWYGRYSRDLGSVPDFNFPSVSWNNKHAHQKGSNPDVAINNHGYIVEVHQSNNNNTELWYNTGKLLPDGTIHWLYEDNGDRNYDNGIWPSVAVNDHMTVVEVHRSQNTNGIYYNIGKMDSISGKITWFIQSQKVDEGGYPNVAINNDNHVLEVHNAYYSDELWYNVGQISDDTAITWGGMGNYRNYGSGLAPSVALEGDTVFEMHMSSTDYLWCRIGRLATGQFQIDWKGTNGTTSTHSYPCEEGGNTFPSPALNKTKALEIHVSMNSGLWYRPGKLSSTVMAMGASEYLSGVPLAFLGQKCSLDMNEQYAILMYAGSQESLIYMIGILN